MRSKEKFYKEYGGSEAHLLQEQPSQIAEQPQQQQEWWPQADDEWYPVPPPPVPTDAEIAAMSDQELLVLARTGGFRRPGKDGKGDRKGGKNGCKKGGATYMPPKDRGEIFCINCGGR